MKIYNDDCLIVLDEFIKKNVSVDYVFTSPPYNRKRNDKYENYNDSKEDWLEMNCKVIDKLLKITKKHIFYNIQSNYYNRADVYKIIGRYSDIIADIHIWEKTNPMPASGDSITNAVEFFIVLGKESLKSNKTYTKNIVKSSVNSNMPKNHKAVMKQEIADYFIETFTKKGDIVLDCFMGTGTTGISCIKTGREFIGIELDKSYFETAKQRINGTCNIEKTLGGQTDIFDMVGESL